MKSTQQLQQEGLRRLSDPKIRYVIGLDEVGYGAWAGPCCLGAVVVPADWKDARVKDSKKLSAHAREQLATSTLSPASLLASYVLETGADEIDRVGLVRARDALAADAARICLRDFPESVIVMDGNTLPTGMPTRGQFGVVYFPKADSLVPAVSAASVIAKVYRDALMGWYHHKYPQYGFDTNMGYGTHVHEQGLLHHGVCPIHRKSYQNIRQLLEQGK